MTEEILITGQPGFQWDVLSCTADVAIIGGSAGCGKTFTLLLDPVRDLHVSGFYGIIFRRENVQIYNPGGLWDKGVELYLNLPFPLVARHRAKPATFNFLPGSKVVFGHLNMTMDVLKYQGSEIPYIAFDELTHFEQYQFIYMLSRNRSTCGIPPRIRASCNPQGDGWVKDLVSWWLYPDDYYIEALRALPRPDRRGVVRYFAAWENQFLFGDTREEVWMQFPGSERAKFPMEAIKSITFIGGTLEDNAILTKADPGYIGGLMAQEESDRVQLLEGRWINIDLDSRRLYSDAEIFDLFTNSFVEGTGNRYMTADVALEGSDLFTVGIWDGYVLEYYYEYQVLLPEEVEPLLIDLAKAHRIPESHIAFDANGVGAMLSGKFRNAFPVVAQSKPLPDAIETGYRKETPTIPQYVNLRSQLYWKFKHVLADREVYIAVKDVSLRQRLVQELRAITKITLTNGKLGVVPKEEIKAKIKRSPDIADMLVMREVFNLIKPARKSFTRKIRTV